MTRRWPYSLGYGRDEGPETGSSFKFWEQKRGLGVIVEGRGKWPGWFVGSETAVACTRDFST